nr:lipid phosphate phosphatase 2-like [Ipomoea batatas]
MPPQLGAQTFRSHGKEIARIHMHDWIILFLLVVIEVVLNVIEPFHRFVGADMMTDLKYPMKDNTIPVWAVPIIAIILPFTVMLGFFFRGTGRNVFDLHQAILGLLFSVLITGVITDAIKDGVGRPRPDFFWRCFPDGKGVFDSVTGNVKCTGLKNVIKEGHKSFPSGHTSCLDHKGHAAKAMQLFVPTFTVCRISWSSRVDDYWAMEDVFAGGFIRILRGIGHFYYIQVVLPLSINSNGWGSQGNGKTAPNIRPKQ